VPPSTPPKWIHHDPPIAELSECRNFRKFSLQSAANITGPAQGSEAGYHRVIGRGKPWENNGHLEQNWLVVEPPLWTIWVRQLGWLFPIYGKIKNVPNHQPENITVAAWSFSSNLPSGKRLRNYGTIHPFLIGKSTISMAIFNSYVKLPEGRSTCDIGIKPGWG